MALFIRLLMILGCVFVIVWLSWALPKTCDPATIDCYTEPSPWVIMENEFVKYKMEKPYGIITKEEQDQ